MHRPTRRIAWSVPGCVFAACPVAFIAAAACGDSSPATGMVALAGMDAGARARDGSALVVDASSPVVDAGSPVPQSVPQSYALSVSTVDTTFVTEDHFIASVEMQLSGEPFAEAMGRDLSGYSRDYNCTGTVCSPSVYWDPALPPADDGGPVGRIDLAGFSSGIESYEYSKQPMNNIAFESGAGTSLLFGPVLNPTGVTGIDAVQLAQTWFLHMAGASNATERFVSAQFSGTNVLGWPGLWPTLQPFTFWNPAIQPTHDTGCSISSDDDPGLKGALPSDNYECDSTSLHLPDRQGAVSMTIGPGASGWTDWKEALWTLNYLQVMHGGHEDAVDSVAPSRLSSVGMPGNGVVAGVFPGVYLGSSDIEGFQAGNFIQILDNQAAQWLAQLTTVDGATLGGFATLADALAYDTTGAARWFPGSITVTEASDASGFPRPSDYAIASADSHLLDLAGLLGAYASAYSLTDQGNSAVGGSQPALAYFDGDPFPSQNQVPDGEPTLHDRALAMMRVLVVNMGRLHVDPATGLLADDFTAASGVRGSVLSSDVAAYALLSLRTARRALDSELTLYSNTTPDTAGIPSPLDAFPPVAGLPFGPRLDQLIGVLAGVFYDKLTSADGRAFSGWDRARGAPIDDGSNLDGHTAAIRGLLTAYLATGAVKYRERAESVFARLESSFYDPAARIYRPALGDRSLQVTFTPRRFGLLQAALRDMYELVGVLPGNDAMRALIEDRVGRLNKLVLNGWDDRDEDGLVEWPGECARLGTGPDGQPLGLGGLQMAERTLSGETGSQVDVFDAATRVIATDREHDCVPEISAVGLPSALANSITFALTPWAPGDNHVAYGADGGVR
ncbi:MAG TPA: hypothetical protein VK762_12850 [Polyangiaceae bacterium]|nr:hypothetical protein [Polyangiaceae bacterium]